MPGVDPRTVDLRIVIDDRESRSGLPEAIARLWDATHVGRLTAGDIEIGPQVLAERKTVVDFLASLDDGRLFDQARRLTCLSRRPLLIIEGEDALHANVEPKALRGALLSILCGFRLPILRTSDVEDTAIHVAHIAHQERRRAARRATPQLPARLASEVFGAMPGVVDRRARPRVEGHGPASIEEGPDRRDGDG